MPRSPVTLFFLRVVLWMPVVFGLWYFMAIVATWPVTYLVKQSLPSLYPDVISAIRQSGYMVETAVFHQLAATDLTLREGQIAELVFEVNALSYGYCIPLYTSLILAAPSEEGEKWFRWIVGVGVLILTQSWGVSFDILKSLLFNLGPEVANALALNNWQREGVALGYQFGYLILPAVTPIVIWVAFHSDYLKTLSPNFSLQK